MKAYRPPFPDHIRRRPHPARRGRAGLLLCLAAVAGLLLLPSLWTVRRVRVQGGAGMPAAERANLELLRGTAMILVDPSWVRDRMEMWPGATSVEVRRELDGTLVLRQVACRPAGSLRTGRGWHAVCADGGPGGRLRAPLPPILEGLSPEAGALRRALAAAERVRSSGFGPVRRVRAVLPGELEVWVGRAGRPARLLLATTGSPAEAALQARLGGGELPPGAFADLSRDDRMVVALAGEGGT